MANQDNKNFVDSVINTQKQVVDTMVENTKKFANGNTMVNETIEKGSDWYKNWLDTQKNFFGQTTERTEKVADTAKDNMSKMNEFYQNWFNTQMGWAKQMWEMNMNHMKQATTTNNATSTDPFSMWNNWMNGMNNTNNWMNMMNQWQNINPFNMDAWKKNSESWTGIMNQYYSLLNNNVTQWQNNMQNGTAQDAYRGMVNVSEGYTRFMEMWMPLWKSIQEKTFNTEMYKQWMNPAIYKDMMDKYFGFMPEQSRQYFQNMSNMMQQNMGQMSNMGTAQYQQMRQMMNGMMPNTSDMFGGMLNGYNQWFNMMSEAAAPFTKMIPANQYTKTMAEWSDISNRIAVYNMKNAEMQYMMYTQGTKVMDQVAENIAAKIKNGEEITSMMGVYQEWLNIADKVYVSLFESENYSKIMAEVSAMQLTLRKDVEGQLEKFMVGVPVATRSEMDELYKTIYDLKKQVRELQRTNENAETIAATTTTTEEANAETAARTRNGKK